MSDTCEIEECHNPRYQRVWCQMHYMRWYKHGDPLHTTRCPPNLSIEDKLLWHGWDVVETGCWETRSRKTFEGYGIIKHDARYEGAHRWAYRAWVGPIPEGLLIRHECDNPPCINPDHLETGTDADNARDKKTRGRGRGLSGSDHWYAIEISDRKIHDIRCARELGRTYKQLSEDTGISKTTIARIINRQGRCAVE